jgi:hypothetical protein
MEKERKVKGEGGRGTSGKKSEEWIVCVGGRMLCCVVLCCLEEECREVLGE